MKTSSTIKLIAAACVLSLCSTQTYAQTQPEAEATSNFTAYSKFRVTLKDKKNNEFSVKHPEAFLSQRAIDRRKKQGIKIDETDLPVNRSYINAIAATGVKVIQTSKWNNTVVISVENDELVQQVADLDCVSKVEKVAIYTAPRKTNTADRHALVFPKQKQDEVQTDTVEAGSEDLMKSDTLIFNPQTTSANVFIGQMNDFLRKISKKLSSKPADSDEAEGEEEPELTYYGKAIKQITQLNGEALHAAGFKGDGMVIAIIDGGFYNADIIPGLSKAKILGTKDFVAPEEEFYGTESHGMMVLSCIAANEPNKLVGMAPEASFWLLRSEDGDTEQPIEEDNWASAIEYADSVGADVVNTSLGYADFDGPFNDVRYDELDGHSQLISNSASMCADKGMVLVCSAGNSGNDQWKLITSPADSKNTLTVGAVSEHGGNTAFSSIGFTTDGRIKPDIATRGGDAWLYGTDGKVTTASGTSFASPIACGMVACLWQALPNLTAKQIVEVVRKSGDRAEHPDPVYGCGIPDFFKAYSIGLAQ